MKKLYDDSIQLGLIKEAGWIRLKARMPYGLNLKTQCEGAGRYSLVGSDVAWESRGTAIDPVNSINNYTRNWYPQIWDLAYEGVVWNEDNQRNEEQQGLGRD